MTFPILSSLVALPIAGALLLLFVREEERNRSRDRVDEVLAQLAGELLQFRRRQPTQVGGRADRGEQRVRRCGAHGA
jgi:hypothetical protein